MEMSRLCFLPLSLLLLTFYVGLTSGQCKQDQQSLLLSLKGSLTFDEGDWHSYPSMLVTWNSSRDCCDWEGVTCDPAGHGHVIGLDLSDKWISGWSPSGIFGLKYLRSLNLAFNSFGFNTTLPRELANLTELVYLNLSTTGFIGQVPAELSQMTKLVTLDLSCIDLDLSNLLIIESPNLASLVRNLSKLVELYLDGINLYQGGKDWGKALSSSLPNLQVLSLSKCNLSGSVDASLKKLKFISTIDLSSNNLSELDPKIFMSFSSLTALYLRNCTLNGAFTDTILQIPSLETIDLSHNYELSLSFPEFSQNQSLENVLLSYTNISGKLPQSIGYLKNLAKIDLEGCNLAGEIPASIFEIQSLQQIRLSFNQFGGQIPEFSSTSTAMLNVLDLSSNNLVGPIPRSLFNLSRLNQLSLSNNKLNGSIQFDWFRKLADLSTLDLSNNNLNVEVTSSVPNLSSFPQFEKLILASCNLTRGDGKLKTSSMVVCQNVFYLHGKL